MNKKQPKTSKNNPVPQPTNQRTLYIRITPHTTCSQNRMTNIHENTYDLCRIFDIVNVPEKYGF